MVMLDTVRQYVVPSDHLSQAFDEVKFYAQDFRAEITRSGFPSGQRSDPIEQARQLTLLSLDRLDDALTNARPNEFAHAMGMDWF